MGLPAPISPKPTPWNSFILKLGRRVSGLVIEFVGTFVTIAGIALGDLLVKWWLGEDKKFFGLVPASWAFDLGHVLIIGRLIYRIFVPEEMD